MKRLAVAALLLAVACGLYANALGNGFVFDDLSTFAKNEALKRGAVLELLADYRPVRYLSFLLDRAVSGDDPWAYHFLNAIHHGLASFLVYLVLCRLLGEGWAALAGALIFVTHPVHTESVAYVSGRRDLLTTAFALLAFLAWLRFRDDPRPRWLGAALISFLLALGAKEMAITLPVLCLLVDLLLGTASARRRLPLYAAVAAVTGGAIAAILLSNVTHQQEWHGGSASAQLGTSLRLVVHYAGLFLFPLRLVADYSPDAFPLSRSALEARAVLAGSLVAAAIAAAVLLRRRAPLVSLGIGWFLVSLLPVLHVVPFHELAAEHHLYLPSVGLCLLAGLGFRRGSERAPRTALLLLLVVLGAFGVRTVVRNRDWRDSETLWAATVRDAPRCARARANLAVVYAARGDWSDAALELERAIEIRPGYTLARLHLAKVHLAMGKVPEARMQLEEALRLARAERRSEVLVGDVQRLLGRCDDAIGAYEESIRRSTRAAPSLRGVLACRLELGDYPAALDAAERLVLLEPESPALLEQAAALARQVGDEKRAVLYSLRARQLGAARRAPAR
jgi:Tfp pilus assembly protein PilF